MRHIRNKLQLIQLSLHLRSPFPPLHNLQDLLHRRGVKERLLDSSRHDVVVDARFHRSNALSAVNYRAGFIQILNFFGPVATGSFFPGGFRAISSGNDIDSHWIRYQGISRYRKRIWRIILKIPSRIRAIEDI
ncbi:hypothetical protein V2J09_019653 [Rumex salicifolius]